MKPMVNKRHHSDGRGLEPVAGEVWWVENLSMGNGQSKSRPVVVMAVSGETVTYCQCTTKTSAVRRRYVVMDPEWAGLDKECQIDMERHTISVKRLSRRLGSLCEMDLDGIGL